MPGRNQFHAQKDDFITVFAGIGLVLVLLLAVVWFQYHPYISWLAIKMAWLSVPPLEYGHHYLIEAGIPSSFVDILIPKELIDDIPSLKYWLPRTDPKQVSFNEFTKLLEICGYSARIFSLPVCIFCIWYILHRSKAARMSRVLNIFTLSRQTMNQFPQIRPAIIENLLEKDPDSGYFRREDSPIRFAIKNDLVKAYDVNFKGELLPKIVTPTFDKIKALKNKEQYEYIKDNLEKGISKIHNRCILDKDKTEKAFIKQLGQPWNGSSSLPPFIRGLYAALITFASGDKDTSKDLLDQFNRTWQPPTSKSIWKPFSKESVASIDITGTDKLIAKYEQTEDIQNIINSHAYVTTVMARLLEAARKKGRLGTSLFIWLKVIDRVLWYSLNQEGGQTGWTEAAGPRAHLLAEKKAKGPLHKPFVKTAVDEYALYLDSKEGWIPLPEDCPSSDKE